MAAGREGIKGNTEWEPGTMSNEGETGAPFRMWGVPGTDFDEPSISQLRNACQLPVAAAGALMPDAHVGYGLPIGGVLATRGAVVPYAVGVDIACRMKLTVLDIPAAVLEKEHERRRLVDAIEAETKFGVGGEYRGRDRREHAVMDMDWSGSHITRSGRDKAWNQLGTSGSGNHFAEFGVLEVMQGGAPRLPKEAVKADDAREQRKRIAQGGSGWWFDLPPGRYVALLTHSGSRGTGAAVCNHYSKLAMNLRPDLSRELRYLAWLDLDSQAGQEYWQAMNLMGEYAAANHAVIHQQVAKHLGAEVIAGVENHHNFAWKERHVVRQADGSEREEEVIVHRKGATPAAAGVLGVIPGSMSAPGFVVRGKGVAGSLNSASHGAGRQMSRTKARESFRFGAVRGMLAKEGITVLSAGSDESPGAYKDIHRVMEMQHDLVEVVAKFEPRIVKMAPEGEKAED